MRFIGPRRMALRKTGMMLAAAILLSLACTSMSLRLSAFGGYEMTAGLAGQIPPSQGAMAVIEAQTYEYKVMSARNGISMVSFKASADISPGVSFVTAGEVDEGLIDGSLMVSAVDSLSSVESTVTSQKADGRKAIGWQVLSKDGGPCSYKVTFLTTSIRWSVSGLVSARKSMKADIDMFLAVSNSSKMPYKGVELVLYGNEGSIWTSQAGSIVGSQLWSQLKPVSESIDLAAMGDIRIPIASMKGLGYKTFVGAAISSELKGYTGKQITKDTLRLDIFLETDTAAELAALPSSSLSLTVYLDDGNGFIVPAAMVPASEVQVSNNKLTMRLDSTSQVSAEIERLDSKAVGTSTYEESFRIRVKSASPFPTEIQFKESFPGEWELISFFGGEWTKFGLSAVLKLTVPAKGIFEAMYKVRYTYVR